MADRRALVMTAQFKKATKDPSEYIKYYMPEDNINEWWILLYNFDGNNNEFKGGEYLVKMIAPEKFPFEPPQFYLHTENGVYGIKEKVCVSIGEYHKDAYPAALGMSGFAENLVSGLIGWKQLGGGINILKTDVAHKKILAMKSRKFNLENYQDTIVRIESCFDEYSKKWDVTKVPPSLHKRMGIVTKEEQSTEKNDGKLEDVEQGMEKLNVK
jgi:ubiquitin-protein ligase